jgi:ubiquinone/menaquinone biosynthesis C-methylase UbiE
MLPDGGTLLKARARPPQRITPIATDSDHYTHGLQLAASARHGTRTAESDAAYLLPHLRPGMRLLDVGCAAGMITEGLARAVAPGAVVGTDVEPAALLDAQARADAAGLAAVRFEEASVYALPFSDAAFDAVHAHQVFQHLVRPVDAAHEVLRVLAPGGIFGARDADYSTMAHWPPCPPLDQWLALYHAVTARNGAEPDASRRLLSWLRAAGFARARVSTTTVEFAEPVEVRAWGEAWAARATESSLATQALEYGFATIEELEEIAAAWREWVHQPDAFFMYTNVECIAVKATLRAE